MLDFLQLFTDGVNAQIIGGPYGEASTMAVLFLVTILVAVLLAARLDLELALVIVSPAIILASFGGLLPPLAFGMMVLLLSLFFGGIILALMR